MTWKFLNHILRKYLYIAACGRLIKSCLLRLLYNEFICYGLDPCGRVWCISVWPSKVLFIYPDNILYWNFLHNVMTMIKMNIITLVIFIFLQLSRGIDWLVYWLAHHISTNNTSMCPSTWQIQANYQVNTTCTEGGRFESHFSRKVGSLGKSLQLPVALQRVNSDTVSMLKSRAPLSS